MATAVSETEGRTESIDRPQRRQRIFFISPFHREGGLATYSQFLVDAWNETLPEREVTVRPWDAEPLLVRGSGVVALSSNIVKEIHRSDLVHIQYIFNRYVLSLPVLLLYCLVMRTPVVLTDHNAQYRDLPFPRFFYLYHQVLYFAIDGIIVHSRPRKEFIWERHHHKVHVVPHGVVHREDVHREPRPIRRLLVPGFIRANKGHELAIRAMAVLPSSYSLDVVGPVHEERYFEHLRTLTSELGLSERVTFLTGFVPEDELDSAINSADLVVLPYKKSRPMSGILGHCISWKTPAVLTDFPAFRDAVDCDHAFFDPRTPEALQRAILRLDEHPEEQREIIETFDRLSAERSWENVARETAQLYDDVLSG